MKKYKPKFTEKIDGGLADNLSIKDIAEKHNVEFSVILDQIEKGIQVEYEHTNNFDIAKEIAMDHLVEYPYYYDELEKMEKKFEHKRGIEVKKYNRKFKEDAGEDKSLEAIKDLIDTKWSGSNEDQGKAVALLKGLAFSDTDISNKFMKELDKFTSRLKIEDFE